MPGESEEDVALTSDLLARIKSLEDKQGNAAGPPDSRLDDLQEQLSTLESRIQGTQERKIRSLEARMTDTRQKLNRARSARYLDLDSDDDSVMDEERAFPDNTFSFLLLVKYPLCEKKADEGEDELEASRHKGKNSPDYLCLPFWLALAVLVIQLTIYSLALQNAADFNNPDNPFQFPINVDPFTRAAELLAVIITVYTQNNIFQGVDLFVQSFKYIREIPGVKAWKYYTAASTQTVVGIYGIFVTFVIIMQSTEVVDLLLDFTAMEFVAALDDAAFALSLRGFLGRAMKKTARTVKTARYTPRDKRTWLRKWPMFVVSILLVTCYVIVRVGQDRRIFGDNEIYVQLHDNAIPWLSTLSGTYIGCTISRSDRNDRDVGPIVYTKHPVKVCDENWKREQGAFFFCENKRWVFVVGEDMNEPCNKWTMQSSKADATNADAYDILSHASARWFAKDLNGLVGDGVVEGIGILGSFDLAENAAGACDILQSEGVAFTFPLYNRLENAMISDRPVFYAGGDLQSGEFILFDGRRWTAIPERSLELECLPNCGMQTETDPLSCKADCLRTFDPFASNYTARLISDPMDLRTTSDTWIPTESLIWYQAKGAGSSSSPAVERVSLAQSIQDIPELLRVVAAKRATPEQLAEAEGLFTQSSSLACLCRANDDACKEQTTCPQGSSLLIDLTTDEYGGETSFFLMDSYSYAAFADEAANILDIQEWLNTSSHLEGVEFLSETGFFSWRNGRSIHFEDSSPYRYKTCMPPNTCAMLSFEDSFGDGIYFPGSFNVFFDRHRLAIDDNLSSITHCLYQFGPACEPSVNCSSKFLYPSYNPDLTCPGGTSLAFEAQQQRLAPITFLLTDFDAWAESRGSDAKPLNGTGVFEWQSVSGGPLEQFEVNRYATCVPDGVCAVMDVAFGSDAWFTLAYNQTRIEPDNSQFNPATFESTYCVYQVGSSCSEPGVVCSDELSVPDFNPEVDCPRGSPLAFQVFTDTYPWENSVIMVDIDSWNVDQGQNTQVLNATGQFPFQNVQVDFMLSESSYRYSTCVPDDVCAVLVFTDTAGDGVEGLGGIKVAYDRQELSLANESSLFSYCQFQVGACEEDVFCSFDGLATTPPEFAP